MPPHKAIGQRAIKDILNARSVTDLSRYFIFPMPTQIGPNLHIYQTPQELAQGYAALAQAKAQKGQSGFHSRIAAIELPRNNRFRVWVDWLYSDHTGTPRTGERSIYFCSILRGQIAVEMIQCAPSAQTTSGLQRSTQPVSA